MTSSSEIDRIDALAELIVTGKPGMKGCRSYGIRAAILRGLEAYEAEAKAKVKSPTKSRSSTSRSSRPNRPSLVARGKR